MKKNNTVSTTSVSSFFTDSPFSKQQNENFSYDSNEMLSTNEEEEEELIVLQVGRGSRFDDPDRLREILVLTDDVELGEI